MKRISKEEILERIGPEAIFRKYIDYDFTLKKPFRSELREEHNPSANVYPYNGTILYNDFAANALNCFQYVMEKFNVTFPESLEIIARDFNLDNTHSEAIHNKPAPVKKLPKIQQERSKFEYKEKPLEKHEIEYFDQFNRFKVIPTDEALHEYNFIPLKYFRFYSTRKQEWSTWIESSKWEPAFLIKIGQNQKIYRPLSATLKWLSNTTADDIFGLEQIKERVSKLGILAGQKDILSYYMNTGNRSIAFSSEGASFTPEKFLTIRQYADELFMLYDNDKTGIKKMNEVTKFYPIQGCYMNKFLRYSCLKGSTGIKDVALWYKYMKDNNLNRDRLVELINGFYDNL